MVEAFLDWVGHKAVGLLSRIMFALDVIAYAELPPGPKIIAANHPSTTDPFVLLGYTRKRSRVMIKGVLFDVPVFGLYLRASGHICVRNGGTAFDEAVRTLESGETVIIFPEGDITPDDGSFLRPHTGVARLALATGAPVIPLGIHLDRKRIHRIQTQVKGNSEVGMWYLRGPYSITIGEAMHFIGSLNDREQVVRTAERIMASIRELAQESRQRLLARQLRVAGPA